MSPLKPSPSGTGVSLFLKTRSLGLPDPLDEDQIVSDPSITPLVDIFLVLLISFMVSSAVFSLGGVGVQLPRAHSAQKAKAQEGVRISLLPSGQVVIDQKSVDFSASLRHTLTAHQKGELVRLLKNSFEKQKTDLVILEGDQKSFLGSAIEIMDLARQAGAQRFMIATAQPEVGKKEK